VTLGRYGNLRASAGKTSGANSRRSSGLGNRTEKKRNTGNKISRVAARACSCFVGQNGARVMRKGLTTSRTPEMDGGMLPKHNSRGTIGDEIILGAFGKEGTSKALWYDNWPLKKKLRSAGTSRVLQQTGGA